MFCEIIEISSMNKTSHSLMFLMVFFERVRHSSSPARCPSFTPDQLKTHILKLVISNNNTASAILHWKENIIPTNSHNEKKLTSPIKIQHSNESCCNITLTTYIDRCFISLYTGIPEKHHPMKMVPHIQWRHRKKIFITLACLWLIIF